MTTPAAAVPSIAALSNAADGNYKSWLAEVTARLEKYRQLATADPRHGGGGDSSSASSSLNTSNVTSSSSSSSSSATATSKQQQQRRKKKDEEAFLQMTRREIEVLAAYHCELQRMIGEQNQKVESTQTELEDTSALAERLQVEVEKKTGGGISPRRRAKIQLRSEIEKVRSQIETTHQNLLGAQGELEGVRAEHADVRQFVARQFFPVARVSADQKWHTVQQQQQQAVAASSRNNNDNVGGGGQFVVKPTKAQQMRYEMAEERKKGMVPGTHIRSTTHVESKLSSQSGARRRSESGANNNNNNPTSSSSAGAGAGGSERTTTPHDSASRVRQYEAEGNSAARKGHLAFIRKKIEHHNNNNRSDSTASSSSYSPLGLSSASSGSGGGGGNNSSSSGTKRRSSPSVSSQLSQERHARMGSGKPAWKGVSLYKTTESRGTWEHVEPSSYGGFIEED